MIDNESKCFTKGQGIYPRSRASSLSEANRVIAALQAKVEELTEWNGISIGLKCPACDDVGWYVAFNGEQEQCEFCYTCPDSIFNRKAALKEEDEK